MMRIRVTPREGRDKTAWRDAAMRRDSQDVTLHTRLSDGLAACPAEPRRREFLSVAACFQGLRPLAGCVQMAAGASE